MTYCQTQKTERGFTLVELAIVLIIVGLLIGGILKGQELIQNARVTATVSQIKGFEAATNTFRDSFNSLPGDMANGINRLPNCTGTCNVGGANIGNGVINQDPGAAMAVEGLATFTQLAAADLISGANPTPLDAAATIGDESPQSELGGSGFVMGFAGVAPTSVVGTTPWQGGTYVSITPNPAAVIPTAVGTNVMKPTDAAKIDNKIDDGLPNQGTVRAAGATAATACAASRTVVTAAYVNSTTNDCSVFVRIQ